MFSRKSRLSRSKDIERVVRFGSRLVTPYIVIYYLQTEGEGVRLACVAGKKVSLSSVRRHRAQRLLRSLAKEFIANIPAGMDLVWVGQSNIDKIEGLSDLRQSLAPFADRLPFNKVV